MAINTTIRFPSFSYDGPWRDLPKTIRQITERAIQEAEKRYQEEYKKQYG